MIQLKGTTKTYQCSEKEVKAIDQVDLTIEKGEFVIIIGRSGSGKSTLLGALGGLIRPTTGQVLLNGQDLWSLPDKRLAAVRGESIGFVFQFSGLMSTLTALENVLLPTMFAGKAVDGRERASELMSKLGLAERGGSFPHQLSGGEMKRVAIARALINDPEVLLADEPTGDLDSATEIEIMELMKDINDGGKTVVMVTHNPDLASYATALYRMERGRIERITAEGGRGS